MVNILPYRWIKSTAIKERLDLANKLNEVIEVVNSQINNIVDITMTTNNGQFTTTFIFNDGTTKSYTYSLSDYVTNTALATVLNGYVAKTGVNVVRGDIQVPTTPATDESVVNSFYVNDSTGSISNNLLHKDGIETGIGKKMLCNVGTIPTVVKNGTTHVYEFFKTKATVNTHYIMAIVVTRHYAGILSISAVVTNNDNTFEITSLSGQSISLWTGAITNMCVYGYIDNENYLYIGIGNDTQSNVNHAVTIISTSTSGGNPNPEIVYPINARVAVNTSMVKVSVIS